MTEALQVASGLPEWSRSPSRVEPAAELGGASPKLRYHSAIVDRLALAVKNYISRHRSKKRKELSHFSSLPTLEEAITWAALGKDERGKRHPHQTRLTELNLQRSRYKLLGVREEIQACETFAELLSVIERESGRIKGLGELYCYDTALRIGAHLGISPQRVYFHAGTRDGARALGFSGDEASIDVRQLPDALWELEPVEVEDLLCIYKAQLKAKDEK